MNMSKQFKIEDFLMSDGSGRVDWRKVKTQAQMDFIKAKRREWVNEAQQNKK